MREKELSDPQLLSVIFIIAVICYAPMGIGTVFAIDFKTVQTFQGTIPAGTENFNVTLSPVLTNVSRSYAILTFNFTQDSDVSKISRSWAIVDNSTLTIFGGSSDPTTNVEVKFAGNVVEFFDADIQHLFFNMSASEPEGEFEIPFDNPINVTSSFIIFDGMTVDSEEFSWGIEEFARIRILNSTHYGIQVGDTPNTEPTIFRVSVIDTKGKTFLQTGTGNLTKGQTIDTITPSTAVNTTKSLVLCTQFLDTGSPLNARPKDVSLSCSITGAGDVELTISDGRVGDFVQYHFQLIEFDENVFVQRDSIAISGGTNEVTDTLPIAVNASNAWVTSGSMSPFGHGNSEGSQAGQGSFDRDSFTMFMVDGTTIKMARGDSGGANLMKWQVLEMQQVGVPPVTGQVIIDDTVNATDSIVVLANKILDNPNNNNVTSTDSIVVSANKILDNPNNNNVTATDTVTTVIGFVEVINNNNVTATDTVTTVSGFVEVIDNNNVTATDTVILNITKVLDGDLVTATDTVATAIAFIQAVGTNDNNVNVTDSVVTMLGVTQIIPSAANNVNVTDSILTTLAINVIINDSTVTIADPIVNATLVVPPVIPPPPPGGGGASSGGGGVPSQPISASLTGISASEPEHTLSTEIIVNPFFLPEAELGTVVLNWDQQEPVKITRISVPPEFEGFVDFKQEGIFEFAGAKANPTDDFSTGLILYEVKIPTLALGVSPENNPFGDAVTFDNFLQLAFLNEYTIPVTIEAVHNANPFTFETEITISHFKEVKWIVIGLTIAGVAWLAVWGRRAFGPQTVKTGTFRKSLAQAKRGSSTKQKPGSFRKELERQKRADKTKFRRKK